MNGQCEPVSASVQHESSKDVLYKTGKAIINLSQTKHMKGGSLDWYFRASVAPVAPHP